jgi:hypothetical protein
VQIDIDQTGEWAPALDRQLRDLIPHDLAALRRGAQPEFLSDARELIFSQSDNDQVVARCWAWISSGTVIAYHGTRLDQNGRASVLAQGLRRLEVAARTDTLRERLAQHPEWTGRQHELDHLIAKSAGEWGMMGSREGQVHLSVSRTSLIRDCNHYLVEGSEFDGHAARSLFGMHGQRLLQAGRDPTLFKLELPGAIALEAANPWGRPRPLPNLIREMLDIWSYRQFEEGYAPSKGIDCGMMFKVDLPPEWIRGFEIVDEAELLEFYSPPIRE